MYGLQLGLCSQRDGHTQEGGVNGDTLGTVVSFEDSNQTIGQLKHVVAETNDNELSILGPLL